MLNLCNECSARVDLAVYKKIFEEINKLQKQVQDKYSEAHEILAEMRKSLQLK